MRAGFCFGLVFFCCCCCELRALHGKLLCEISVLLPFELMCCLFLILHSVLQSQCTGYIQRSFKMCKCLNSLFQSPLRLSVFFSRLWATSKQPGNYFNLCPTFLLSCTDYFTCLCYLTSMYKDTHSSD